MATTIEISKDTAHGLIRETAIATGTSAVGSPRGNVNPATVHSAIIRASKVELLALASRAELHVTRYGYGVTIYYVHPDVDLTGVI